MTTDQFQPLRDALAANLSIIAKPWHWHADQVKGDPLGRSRYEVITLGRTIMRTYYTDEEAVREAALIVAAVNAAPALLAEVERLTAELAAARAAVAELVQGLRDAADMLDVCDSPRTAEAIKALADKHGGPQ